MCICNKSYIRFRMYMSSTFALTLFVCHFVPLCEVIEVFCASLPLLAVISSFFFTFTEKCHCDKVNHLVSIVSITAILVRLLQMIWCYVTRFAMCQSCLTFSLYLQKICISHHNGIMSHAPRFRKWTWSSSHFEELEKNTKLRMDLKFKGGDGNPKGTMVYFRNRIVQWSRQVYHINLEKAELNSRLHTFWHFFYSFLKKGGNPKKRDNLRLIWESFFSFSLCFQLQWEKKFKYHLFFHKKRGNPQNYYLRFLKKASK